MRLGSAEPVQSGVILHWAVQSLAVSLSQLVRACVRRWSIAAADKEGALNGHRGPCGIL